MLKSKSLKKNVSFSVKRQDFQREITDNSMDFDPYEHFFKNTKSQLFIDLTNPKDIQNGAAVRFKQYN